MCVSVGVAGLPGTCDTVTLTAANENPDGNQQQVRTISSFHSVHRQPYKTSQNGLQTVPQNVAGQCTAWPFVDM